MIFRKPPFQNNKKPYLYVLSCNKSVFTFPFTVECEVENILNVLVKMGMKTISYSVAQPYTPVS